LSLAKTNEMEDEKTMFKNFLRLVVLFVGTAFAGVVWAKDLLEGLDTLGKPIPGGTSFQPPATDLARDIQWLDNMLLIFVLATSIFVVVLLGIVVIKYNRKTNPNPATFTHHSALEVTWTLVPVLILIVIGTFSLPILFNQLEIPESEVTIKATGNQWYWNYEYPEHKFSFDAFMLEREDLADYGYKPDEYLLATDYPVVVPVGTNVRMQIAGADVIHAWKIPAFGVHMDAVPGRLNETWFNADKEGVFFGQCSELCGKNHAYMPIVVKVVSKELYEEWLDQAITEFAGEPRKIDLALNK
jgi:cytochrome c oxidase subunit 2